MPTEEKTSVEQQQQGGDLQTTEQLEKNNPALAALAKETEAPKLAFAPSGNEKLDAILKIVTALQRSNSSPVGRKGASGDGWKLSEGPGNSFRYKNGDDELHHYGNRIVGKNGSPQEVGKMFELGAKRGWNPMAFSGDADFKKEVMKAAMARGATLQFSQADMGIYELAVAERQQELKDRAQELGQPAISKNQQSAVPKNEQSAAPKNEQPTIPSNEQSAISQNEPSAISRNEQPAISQHEPSAVPKNEQPAISNNQPSAISQNEQSDKLKRLSLGAPKTRKENVTEESELSATTGKALEKRKSSTLEKTATQSKEASTVFKLTG